jgi:hypothetical protein
MPDESKTKSTAVAPKRRTFLPSLSYYARPGSGSTSLPVRLSCFEVLDKAGIEPWGWFSNFADAKFTFLGRTFTGGVHNILAKQLREDEEAFIAAYGKQKGQGGADEPKGDEPSGGDDDGGADDDEEDDSVLFEKNDDEENDEEDGDDEEHNDTQLTKSEAFEAGTFFGLAGAPGHPRGIKLRGAREIPQSASVSLHFFGLAIDVDYDFNFYPESFGRLSWSNVLAKGRLLLEPTLTPQEKAEVPWGWPHTTSKDKNGKDIYSFKRLKYPDVVKLNENLKRYLALIEDAEALTGMLSSATRDPWKGASVEDAQSIIKNDLADMISVIRSWKKNKKKQAVSARIAQKTGLMTITKEFHKGLGLDWGGAYGDLMHYDARNIAGDPKKISKAIAAFKSNSKRHKELAKIWGPLKGDSNEEARLAELLKAYPKPGG